MNNREKEHLFQLAKAFHDAWTAYQLGLFEATADGPEITKLEAMVRVAETDLVLFCANSKF